MHDRHCRRRQNTSTNISTSPGGPGPPSAGSDHRHHARQPAAAMITTVPTDQRRKGKPKAPFPVRPRRRYVRADAAAHDAGREPAARLRVAQHLHPHQLRLVGARRPFPTAATAAAPGAGQADSPGRHDHLVHPRIKTHIRPLAAGSRRDRGCSILRVNTAGGTHARWLHFLGRQPRHPTLAIALLYPACLVRSGPSSA